MQKSFKVISFGTIQLPKSRPLAKIESFKKEFCFRFSDPLRCDRFKECPRPGVVPQIKECPGNMVFNRKDMECQPQHKVRCINRDIPSEKLEYPFWDVFNNTCPWKYHKYNLFALRGDCNHFIQCTKGITVTKMTCPNTLFFDPVKGLCDVASDQIRLDCSTTNKKYDRSDMQYAKKFHATRDFY